MLREYPIEDEIKNKDMIHYQKINIFGESGVGKTSLISYLENYENGNFVIEEQNELMDINQSINSNIEHFYLVEQIKKIKIKLNEDKNLYLNVYETNIDRLDLIKLNLETLLFQTECIIIMWDNNIRTFENIPHLINIIKDCIKYYCRKVPFILLQNKNDLDLDYDRSIDQNDDIDVDNFIEVIKKENPDYIFKKISLLNRGDICNILLEIDRNIDRTQVDKNEAIDLVKVDYPIKHLNNEREKISVINIALIGDSDTGKSSFLYILNEKNIANMVTTIGIENTIFYAYIKNKKYKIKIMDTAGQERLRSLTSNYIKSMDGILLFFDVTNKCSFKSIDYWRGFINDNNYSKEIILLGNKIDEINKRQVKRSEIKEYAEKNKIKYIECSCKYCFNIYEILNEIILMSFNSFKEKDNRNDVHNIESREEKTKKCIC